MERRLLNASPNRRWYVESSTVWLLGQYFGWVEILRREAQFLKLRETSQQAEVQRLLGAIARACSSDRLGTSRLQIQRSEQRALGELMVVVGRDADARERSDCMGYARFCKELEDEDCDVHLWFAPFCAQVWQRSDDSDRRLVNLQHALITLIEELDPDGIRFPEHRARVQQAR